MEQQGARAHSQLSPPDFQAACCGFDDGDAPPPRLGERAATAWAALPSLLPGVAAAAPLALLCRWRGALPPPSASAAAALVAALPSHAALSLPLLASWAARGAPARADLSAAVDGVLRVFARPSDAPLLPPAPLALFLAAAAAASTPLHERALHTAAACVESASLWREGGGGTFAGERGLAHAACGYLAFAAAASGEAGTDTRWNGVSASRALRASLHIPPDASELPPAAALRCRALFEAAVAAAPATLGRAAWHALSPRHGPPHACAVLAAAGVASAAKAARRQPGGGCVDADVAEAAASLLACAASFASVAPPVRDALALAAVRAAADDAIGGAASAGGVAFDDGSSSHFPPLANSLLPGVHPAVLRRCVSASLFASCASPLDRLTRASFAASQRFAPLPQTSASSLSAACDDASLLLRCPPACEAGAHVRWLAADVAASACERPPLSSRDGRPQPAAPPPPHRVVVCSLLLSETRAFAERCHASHAALASRDAKLLLLPVPRDAASLPFRLAASLLVALASADEHQMASPPPPPPPQQPPSSARFSLPSRLRAFALPLLSRAQPNSASASPLTLPPHRESFLPPSFGGEALSILALLEASRLAAGPAGQPPGLEPLLSRCASLLEAQPAAAHALLSTCAALMPPGWGGGGALRSPVADRSRSHLLRALPFALRRLPPAALASVVAPMALRAARACDAPAAAPHPLGSFDDDEAAAASAAVAAAGHALLRALLAVDASAAAAAGGDGDGGAAFRPADLALPAVSAALDATWPQSNTGGIGVGVGGGGGWATARAANVGATVGAASAALRNAGDSDATFHAAVELARLVASRAAAAQRAADDAATPVAHAAAAAAAAASLRSALFGLIPGCPPAALLATLSAVEDCLFESTAQNGAAGQAQTRALQHQQQQQQLLRAGRGADAGGWLQAAVDEMCDACGAATNHDRKRTCVNWALQTAASL